MCVPAKRQAGCLSGGPSESSLLGPVQIVVLGGVSLTWPLLSQAFFDKDYITKHPGDAEKIAQLKDLMQEQVCLGLGVPWPGGKAMHRMAAGVKGCSLAN